MKKLLILLITLLGLVPFFWFDFGAINIGGDSSRLYFYDPASFLKSYALYGIIPSETGFEAITYSFIPFSLFLVLLKSIFISPYFLITIFYSIMMMGSFLSVYASILELIGKDIHKARRPVLLHLAGIAGGLFYVLTPIIGSNWDKNLISHNQVLLNPVFFYLLLKFVNTQNFVYGLVAIILSFIFAPSFSLSSAPAIFAFFPIAILYLILYSIFISSSRWPIKKSILLLFIAIALHSFHLFPQFLNLFEKDSSTYTRVFSSESIHEGVGYFDGVRKDIRLSRNLAPLSQNATPLFFMDGLLYIFPAFIIGALLLNNRKNANNRLQKNYLLLCLFFLFVLLLDSANITPLITNIYRMFFKLPGFSMFRNFYGQFMYVFFFFYSLIVGYALYILSSLFNIRKWSIFYSLAVILIFIGGWPFIIGVKTNQPFYEGKEGIDGTFIMDKQFDEVLDYFKKTPVEAKVLMFPLTDFGYQVLAGKGGYYLGPSMVGYLTGKKDFAGFPGFSVYTENLLHYAKNRDYEKFNTILGLFNIKYIFHNTDERVYASEYFPKFPFSTARYFLPASQTEYTDFINKLGAKKLTSIGDKYTIYETNPQYFLPHIYTTSGITYINKDNLLFYPSNREKASHRPADFYAERKEEFDEDIFEAQVLEVKNISPYLDFFDSRNPSEYPTPFATYIPSSLIYPIILSKESHQRRNFRDSNFDKFYDYSIFIAEKRLVELERWKDHFRIKSNGSFMNGVDITWKEPSVFQVFRREEYMYWETALLRYERLMSGLLSTIESKPESIYPLNTNKLSLLQKLNEHQHMFETILGQANTLSYEEKLYLQRLIRELFGSIHSKASLVMPDTTLVQYSTDVPVDATYELYVEKNPLTGYDFGTIQLKLNNDSLQVSNESQSELSWIRYQDVHLSKGSKITLDLSLINSFDLMQETEKWKSPENIETQNNTGIVFDQPTDDVRGGVIKVLSNWHSGSIYVLSFNYNTHNNPFIIRLYEQIDDSQKSYIKVFENHLKSEDWTEFKKIIPPSNSSLPRILQIEKGDDSSPSKSDESEVPNNKIDLQKMSLVHIPHPRILLINKNSRPISKIPQISFNKINPTKYKVEVSNATEPYSLVFLDAFSPNWKLYDIHVEQEEGIMQFLLSGFKMFGQGISNLFSNSDIRVQTSTASYFEGDVKEADHTYSFLHPEVFTSWGTKAIAENKHFKVNGYANAWQIHPSDVGSQENYTLVLELTTQRWFYITSLVSLVALILTIVLILRPLFPHVVHHAKKIF